MKVKELMTTSAVSCRSGMSLASAGALMWEHDCGALPLVNDTETVIGIITDRDICIALSTRETTASQITVGEVIKNPPSVCSPDDDIRIALKTMSKARIRRLPVVNEHGGLAGIISFNDILLRAERGDGRRPDISYEDVVQALQAICAHPARAAKRAAA